VGQKIHPKCLRLGITQEHLSNWYGDKTLYSNLISEDFFIRKFLQNFLQQKQISVSDINIQRTNNLTSVFISTPNVAKFVKLNLTEIDFLLKKKIKTLQNIIVVPNNVTDRSKDASLVAEQVVKKLENRYPFKRAMKEAIRQVQASGVEGIKIQISGRLNGAEIARSEWKREGRVPLHTLRAKIGYSYQTASTIYGILGVKVWLFLGEVSKL
jgi:small subunit ribosomal protein S3